MHLCFVQKFGEFVGTQATIKQILLLVTTLPPSKRQTFAPKCTKVHPHTIKYLGPFKKTIWEGFRLLNHYSKKIVLAHSPNMTKIPILNIGYQFSPARNFNTEVTEGFLSTLCIEQSDTELQK